MQVNILSIIGYPKPFDPNVVEATASAIHTYGNILALKVIDPDFVGKQRSLVGVYDFGLAKLCNGLAKQAEAVFSVQRVGKAPTHQIPGIHIYDSCQVQKAPSHRDIRYVDTPNLVRMRDLQIAELVGMIITGNAQFAQVPLGIDSHEAHLPEKTPHSFRTYRKAQYNQQDEHLLNAFSRVSQILFIHLLHDLQVLGTLTNRLVLQVVAVQSPQFVLPALTQVGTPGHYFFEDFKVPSCSEAILQKSTSTSNRPIFTYNAFSRLAASSSGALVEKISELLARNSRFQ